MVMASFRTSFSVLTIILTFVVFNALAGKAEALYIFEWQDGGEEWSNSPWGLELNEPDIWEGSFVLPDSAATFHPWSSGDGVSVYQFPSSTTDIYIQGATNLAFIMDAPPELETPLMVTDHWLNYQDYFFDEETSGWISHNGAFVGRHLVDIAPVPESSTFLLLGSGLVALVCFRRKYKKA
jgi:hypothetical protein